jgi:hypothetical protein
MNYFVCGHELGLGGADFPCPLFDCVSQVCGCGAPNCGKILGKRPKTAKVMEAERLQAKMSEADAKASKKRKRAGAGL